MDWSQLGAAVLAALLHFGYWTAAGCTPQKGWGGGAFLLGFWKFVHWLFDGDELWSRVSVGGGVFGDDLDDVGSDFEERVFDCVLERDGR